MTPIVHPWLRRDATGVFSGIQGGSRENVILLKGKPALMTGAHRAGVRQGGGKGRQEQLGVLCGVKVPYNIVQVPVWIGDVQPGVHDDVPLRVRPTSVKMSSYYALLRLYAGFRS